MSKRRSMFYFMQSSYKKPRSISVQDFMNQKQIAPKYTIPKTLDDIQIIQDNMAESYHKYIEVVTIKQNGGNWRELYSLYLKHKDSVLFSIELYKKLKRDDALNLYNSWMKQLL